MSRRQEHPLRVLTEDERRLLAALCFAQHFDDLHVGKLRLFHARISSIWFGKF